MLKLIFSISVYWPWGQIEWRLVIVAEWNSWVQRSGGGTPRGRDVDERDSDGCRRRGKSHARCTRTSHARASLPAAVMSIRMEMKIFATQIGFTLMKVISLGKKRGLIHKMRIDSGTHSLLSLYLWAEHTPHTHTPPCWSFLLYSLEHTSSVWHPSIIWREKKRAFGFTSGVLWLTNIHVRLCLQLFSLPSLRCHLFANPACVWVVLVI